MRDWGSRDEERMGQTEPLCVVCDQLIRAMETRITVQGEPYHARCWEREAKPNIDF